jgi:hypothetical protein
MESEDSEDSEEQPSGAIKCSKALLDNVGIIAGIIGLFTELLPGSSQKAAVLCLTGFTVTLSIVSIVVDFCWCRFRWANGWEAEFPKVLTLVFLVVNAGIFIAVVADWFSVKDFLAWSGVVIWAALFLGALISWVVGKPFTYAVAVEMFAPEVLKEIQSKPYPSVSGGDNVSGLEMFYLINLDMTLYWTAFFLLNTTVFLIVALVRSQLSDKAQFLMILSATANVYSFGSVFVAWRCVDGVSDWSRARRVKRLNVEDPWKDA